MAPHPGSAARSTTAPLGRQVNTLRSRGRFNRGGSGVGLGKSGEQRTENNTLWVKSLPEAERPRGQQHALKARGGQSVVTAVLQDPRDRVKAGLPEPKSPGVPYHTHRSERVMTMPPPCLSSSVGDKHLLGGGRGPMRTCKEMNWAPTSRCYVLGYGTWDDLRPERARVTELG